ncbi:uncharacterized protein LOC122265031 [Penaeus japonicus]|uniref:uncharacterized protein LOC122265031 n=1 Tax=Penaeus japonicus TaxID=27405 RepID=UPI001C711352|nr:uncharacterized protein LOC122265031 [Penaeus japonicus]
MSRMRFVILVACICLLHVAPSEAVKPWKDQLLAPFYNEQLARIFMDKIVAIMMALKGLATIALAVIGILDKEINGRSLRDEPESQARLLSAISWLDTEGCVLKTLCHLDAMEADARTPEENHLVEVLSNNLDYFSHHVNASALRSGEADPLNPIPDPLNPNPDPLNPTPDPLNPIPDPDLCGVLFSQCPIRIKHMKKLLQHLV